MKKTPLNDLGENLTGSRRIIAEYETINILLAHAALHNLLIKKKRVLPPEVQWYTAYLSFIPLNCITIKSPNRLYTQVT